MRSKTREARPSRQTYLIMDDHDDDDDDDVVVVVVVVDDATCARLRTEIVGDANPGIVVARRLLLKFMNMKTNFVLVEIHSFSFKKIQHLFLSFVDGVLQS